MNTEITPLVCGDNTHKNYRVSWDTPRAPNTHIPEHILRNMQINVSTPKPLRNKPPVFDMKALQQQEEKELLAEAFEGHWGFNRYEELSDLATESSPIPTAPVLSRSQIVAFLRELEQNPCSSYFMCCDKNPVSLEEYLQKTNKAIYSLLEGPSTPYTCAKRALSYFQNRFKDFSADWTNLYLRLIMNNPALQSYVPNNPSLSSIEKLSIACERLPEGLAGEAASIFMKTLGAIEIAELRVKIDFTNIVEYFTGSRPTVEEIFPSGDIVKDIKSWIKTHIDLLKDKRVFTIPPGTHVIPSLLLKDMLDITYIKLSDTPFIEFPLKSIKNILTSPRLEHLDLSNNSFTEFPPELLRTAKNLRTLDLSGNPLSQANKTALAQYCASRFDPDAQEFRPITLII